MKEEKELFSQFEELFWQVTRSMSHVWTKVFEKHFPGSQSYLVFMLERRGLTRMSELAEALQLTPGAVTIASDKLIEHGYVEREKDEHDRRVVYLKLTEKGRATMDTLRLEGRKTMKDIFSHLTENDLNHLIDTFAQAEAKISTIRKGDLK
ncbi:MarR family transcriptional regulator [Sporosarcina sp. Sa2YVA2]|uniref:MarR family transcriptional regulator n=1 Tax=Sporosarcina quadrami TaxID=2762234 RepID=A0ABR8U7X9_9BACL|nr:MarR family transcriptional regulator [Sporosarcina quadrami]MBD7984137.1 MarR family transcriptional regulator [Sporosarcina quadrami]